MPKKLTRERLEELKAVWNDGSGLTDFKEILIKVKSLGNELFEHAEATVEPAAPSTDEAILFELQRVNENLVELRLAVRNS